MPATAGVAMTGAGQEASQEEDSPDPSCPTPTQQCHVFAEPAGITNLVYPKLRDFLGHGAFSTKMGTAVGRLE